MSDECNQRGMMLFNTYLMAEIFLFMLRVYKHVVVLDILCKWVRRTGLNDHIEELGELEYD